ncbi:SPOR domain-containing protein, partial [Ancylobacter polymorphus]
MADVDKDSVRPSARPRKRPAAKARPGAPAPARGAKASPSTAKTRAALAALEQQATSRPARRRAVA